VVVGDQGALDGCAYEPVVPYAGVEREEPLDDAGPQPGGTAAAVAFGAELVLQWCSSICRACSRSPYSLGLARPNPVTVPSQVQMISSLLPQYQREWLGQYPYPAQPHRPERLAVMTECPLGTGVASISRSSDRQPAPLVIKAQQDLGYRDARQLGVSHFRPAARPAPSEPERGNDAIGQFHIQCGQESVQVSDHDGLQGPACVRTSILDTLHISVTGHPRRVALQAPDQARNPGQRPRAQAAPSPGPSMPTQNGGGVQLRSEARHGWALHAPELR
jgi:hypothetical protein